MELTLFKIEHNQGVALRQLERDFHILYVFQCPQTEDSLPALLYRGSTTV